MEIDGTLNGIELFVLLDLIGASKSIIYNFAQNVSTQFNRLMEIELQLHKDNFIPQSVQRIFNGNLLDYQIGDDHVPFQEREILTLHLITVPFPANWHTAEDTLENCDWLFINAITRIVRIFIAECLRLDF